MPKLLNILIGLFLMVGLSVSVHAKEASVPVWLKDGMTACQAPRPEICYQIYQPVCAVLRTPDACADGQCVSTERLTFSNDCMACSDERVLGFELGDCEQVLK